MERERASMATKESSVAESESPVEVDSKGYIREIWYYLKLTSSTYISIKLFLLQPQTYPLLPKLLLLLWHEPLPQQVEAFLFFACLQNPRPILSFPLFEDDLDYCAQHVEVGLDFSQVLGGHPVNELNEDIFWLLDGSDCLLEIRTELGHIAD